MKIPAIFLSLALAAPMAVAQAMPAHSNHSSNNQWNNSSQNSSSNLKQSDQQFLKKLAQEDQSEIKLAHLALQKSNNDQVKDYASGKILAADPSMKAEAESIARQNNCNIPNNVNQKEQQEYQKLSKLSGHQFDQAYMKYEARKQGKDVNVVQHEINTTNNQQVKTYAQKEEPPVKHAAQSAQQIASSMGIQTAQNGSPSY